MNWDAIGAVGEIAGAVAVVITLIYFSRQLRDNQTISTTSNTIDVFDMRIQHREAVNAHIELWMTGNAGGELSETDGAIYRNMLESYEMITFLNYFHRQSIEGRNFKPENSMQVAEFSLFLYENPGARKVWEAIQDRHQRLRQALVNAPLDGGHYVRHVRSNLETLDRGSD